MQVSATLIAAQQAAREARARMALPQAQTQVQTAPQASFASALQDLGATPAPQATAPASMAAPQTAQPASASGRMGQHVNILV